MIHIPPVLSLPPGTSPPPSQIEAEASRLATLMEGVARDHGSRHPFQAHLIAQEAGQLRSGARIPFLTAAETLDARRIIVHGQMLNILRNEASQRETPPSLQEAIDRLAGLPDTVSDEEFHAQFQPLSDRLNELSFRAIQTV